jgi:hypothetical protein
MKSIMATAGASVALTLLAVHILYGASEITRTVRLENPRVTVTEVTYPRGAIREPFTRPSDQVIVFLDDGSYDRIDPATGKTDRLNRPAGDVIWHGKGEHAPRLISRSSKPYRVLVIALK